MDNSTLEALDMDKEEEMVLLEKYRFLFLEYLDAAKKVALFKADAKTVSAMQKVWAHGRILERTEAAMLQEKHALEAERVLSALYALDYSPEGYKQAERQFNVELTTSKEQEGALWDRLCSVVSRIETECEDMTIKPIWFDGYPEKQRLLLTEDSTETFDRISFYQKRLRRFVEEPELPTELEIIFRLVHGSLINVVPFDV